ncbi:hypothetical protein [Thermoleophilum album]|uniref:Response regulatory domain-containing protein n=1 Tax=Thermoleophilum album TaxID=29539 RepID=A0A1H6FZ35_THEAL|nr:hypothetical protein [Thermoleophilum album]SEH15570.1 hypothetical protein SAMN02745716_1995 [Thermoleophilum album]
MRREVRVAVRCDDLLFASRLKEALEAAGHDVELQPVAASLEFRSGGMERFDAVVVDLERLVEGAAGQPSVVPATGTPAPTPGVVVPAKRAAPGSPPPVLGFYPHLRADLPKRAAQLGVDRAVPRSRAAREIVRLVEDLVRSAEC